MTAPVEQVKAAAAQAVASNPDGLLYQLTLDTFYRTYRETYDPRTDRREFERIKHHVRRALSGAGDGRGGRRLGGSGNTAERKSLYSRELRLSHNLSQSEVAAMVGVTTAAISKWESGVRVPSEMHAVRLAEIFPDT